ncbi:MAG: NosD domain-containing protein [Candidatus Bathyarchaeia archaeon]
MMLILAAPSFSATAQDIRVLFVPSQFPTIQDAIDAAEPGDYIRVSRGIYSGSIVIDKEITLIGDGPKTVIDGSGELVAVKIVSDNTVFSGFTVAMARVYGIGLWNADGNMIRGNLITENSDGIYLALSSNNVITGNVIVKNSRGIRLEDSSGNVMFNNFLDNEKNALEEIANRWNVTKTDSVNIVGGRYIGGNFWSDHTEPDSDDDGFRDMPRIIPLKEGRDFLPLTAKGDLQHLAPRKVSLKDSPPKAVFTSESIGAINVLFVDKSYDLDGEIVQRIWNFGDGFVSSAKSPMHYYKVPGAYQVKLSIIDESGLTDEVILVQQVDQSIFPRTFDLVLLGLVGFVAAIVAMIIVTRARSFRT